VFQRLIQDAAVGGDESGLYGGERPTEPPVAE
jgi:hypothetical protein